MCCNNPRQKYYPQRILILVKLFIWRNLVARWWWMLIGLQQLRQGLTDILLLDCWKQSEGKERL